MVRFFSDVDNTLIYYKEALSNRQSVMVEARDAIPTKFIDMAFYEYLLENKKHDGWFTLIPITSRTKEQFQKITCFPHILSRHNEYSIVGGGSKLLINDYEDGEWTEETEQLVAEAQKEMDIAIGIMQTDELCGVDMGDGISAYAKSENPAKTICRLEDNVDLSKVYIYRYKDVVYVMPLVLSKGKAVERFVRRFGATASIGAGDYDATDTSLLNAVNYSIMPRELEDSVRAHHKFVNRKYDLFSDYIMEALKIIHAELEE